MCLLLYDSAIEPSELAVYHIAKSKSLYNMVNELLLKKHNYHSGKY